MLPIARVFCGGSHSSWKVISHKHPHFMDDFPILYHIHPHFMDHPAILGLLGCDGYHFQGFQGFQAPERDSFRTRFQRLLGNSERSKRLGWWSWGCHISWPKSWGNDEKPWDPTEFWICLVDLRGPIFETTPYLFGRVVEHFFCG
jgi:hypothetical protein